MVNSKDKYFELLKGKIVEIMQMKYPGIPDSIADWKGQNIIDFQAELVLSQKEHLSEKWFYTHMKSVNRKLPRIDILNFLSQYVGYQNWEDFKHYQSENKQNVKKERSKQLYYLLPLLIVLMLTTIYLVYQSFYIQEYNFCFYDSVSKESITNGIIEVTLLEKKESPRNFFCDDNGCFILKTNKKNIRFIVESPYFKKDTITRRLNGFNHTETIKLEADDYALMIHYFSSSKVQDWLKRKEDLNQMISDEAKIYQVFEGTIGMEMYNKWEFINKLTLPTNSLSNIEILDTKYENEQITHLSFRQNEK